MKLHPFLTVPLAMATTSQDLSTRIQQDASADGIDLSVLKFTQEAIASITALSTNIFDTSAYDFTNATRIDTHTQYLSRNYPSK